MKNLKIRNLAVSDIPALLALWQKAGLSYRPNGRDRVEKISQELKNSFEAFIGAFHNQQLVAFVLASHDGRKGWINRLAVHPEYRRRGLAKVMISQAENFLKNHGIEIFTCLIEDWNQASMRLFTDMNYQRHDDIIYFSKRLHPDV